MIVREYQLWNEKEICPDPLHVQKTEGKEGEEKDKAVM